MACNNAAALLLKSGFERQLYQQALDLLHRAVSVTQPAREPKRIQIRTATHRILSIASKRRRKPTVRQNRTVTSPIRSPLRASPSRPRGLQVNATVCPIGYKHPEAYKLLRRRQCPDRNSMERASEVEWELLMQCHAAKQTRAQLYVEENESWSEMQAYWELQQRLEQDFLATLDGPAVELCGLTPHQLAELQTRDLSPEDYELLLALDDQIAKKTVDASDIEAFESRPVTPGTEDSCSVCIMDFEPGESCKVLPCGHRFHKDCISKWLSDCNVKCPNCGTDVSPKKKG
eukprot:TRINITY_DN3870_c0_g1_i1.p1 TRINITY_DN3870_c0_g1~~TRINITY_DN3870_c0_g1_i1.p1  ORF type:complete len:289 (-),score=39.87 TRINITY_DN3870_c0_g1_i1:230-1096(-)